MKIAFAQLKVANPRYAPHIVVRFEFCFIFVNYCRNNICIKCIIFETKSKLRWFLLVLKTRFSLLKTNERFPGFKDRSRFLFVRMSRRYRNVLSVLRACFIRSIDGAKGKVLMVFDGISYSDRVFGPALYTFTLRFSTALLWFLVKTLVDLIAKTNETFSFHFPIL